MGSLSEKMFFIWYLLKCVLGENFNENYVLTTG
jgi:hypothetical protein